MRNAMSIFALLACVATPALAGQMPPCVAAGVPHAALVGEGRLTIMMMNIYDAALYAPQGVVASGQPMALSLTYLRHLSGARIADRSIEEIRKQGFGDEITLAAWHGMLSRIIPDVEEGTNLAGILDRNGATVFYRDDEEIGRIDDPAFGRHFFAIWLGPKTSDPSLRAELLHLTE